MSKISDPFFDHHQHLRGMPDATLRDLVRNDSAPWEYRKFAVEILSVRKSPFIKLDYMLPFVHELEIELDGIQFDHPAPSEPMRASVTTETMFGGDVVDMEALRKLQAFSGFDDIVEKDSDAPE